MGLPAALLAVGLTAFGAIVSLLQMESLKLDSATIRAHLWPPWNVGPDLVWWIVGALILLVVVGLVLLVLLLGAGLALLVGYLVRFAWRAFKRGDPV